MTTPGDDQNNDGNQGNDDAAAGELTIDYGGKVNADAPKKLKLGEEVTVTYAASVEKATVTVDDDDPETEAWTKQFKFGPPAQEEIQAEVTQDKEAPRQVTVKATGWPADVDKMMVEWGGNTEGEAPTEVTQDAPEVTAKYAQDVNKATITVDDDNPDTEAFSKVLKFPGGDDPAGEFDIQLSQGEGKEKTREVTLKTEKLPEGVDKAAIDWGGKVGDKAPAELSAESLEAAATYDAAEKGPVTVKVTDPAGKVAEWSQEVEFKDVEIPEKPDEDPPPEDGEKPPPDQGDDSPDQPPKPGTKTKPSGDTKTPAKGSGAAS